MQTLAATLEKFKAYGLELEKIEQSQKANQKPNLESKSQKPSLDFKSLESSLTTKRRPNIARIKAKENKLRKSLESSLASNLESSLESNLDSKSLEWFHTFVRSELERLGKLLTAWRESGKPQRATEQILHQMTKFSDFCRKYEAISTAPIFGVNNQKSNLLPVVYKSHALKRATKPENIGLVGLNPETAQTIGANLAARQTDYTLKLKQANEGK